MTVNISKLTETEIEAKGIRNWPVWTKEVSTFDWYYDEPEQCLFLEGEVTIKTDSGDYQVQKGDYVEFPRGLKCVWVVKKDVRKHYHFG